MCYTSKLVNLIHLASRPYGAWNQKGEQITMGLLKKLFGTTSEKELRSIKPIADKIEALEGTYSALTDQELQAKTPEFKERLKNGETFFPRPLPPAGRPRGGCWA